MTTMIKKKFAHHHNKSYHKTQTQLCIKKIILKQMKEQLNL